jgi:hypothetical protein
MTKKEHQPQPNQPEQRQKSPEAGAGPLGLPPPTPDQTPQGGGSKSPELDIRGQAEEVAPAQGGSESSPVQPLLDVVERLLFRERQWLEKQERWREHRERLKSDPAYQKAHRDKVNAQARRRYHENKEQRKPFFLERLERKRERERQRYHERKEERGLQAEQHQPRQVFPDPLKE